MIHFLKRIFDFHSDSIHRELLLTYLVVLFFVVIVFGGFSVNALVRSNKKIIEDNVSGTMDRLGDDLAFKMRELEGITDQVIIHQASQNVINNPYNTPETVVALRKQVFPHLSNLVVRTPVQTSLSLIIDSDIIPERILGTSFNNSFYNNFAVFSLKEENLPDYRRFSSSKLTWYCDPGDEALGTIVYGRRVLDTQTLDPMGFIMGRINIQEFFQEYKKIDDAETFIRHSSGRIIFVSSEKKEYSFTASRYGILMKTYVPNTQWEILMGVPHAVIREGAFGIIGFSTIIGIVVIILAALLVTIFSRFFSKRLAALSEGMERFQSGDFSVRVEDDHNDEIGRLSNDFNKVVREMEELVKRVKQSENEQKQTEVTLLKAQINPHFLYNSLSSIGHLSKMGKKDETYKLILAVSKFYRLTLNKGNLYIPLGEELQRIMTYLEIQKMKYRERLIIQTDFDEKLNDLDIPDFILQPFLENSFAYGWTEKPLTISISTARSGKNINIRISDNGVGMSLKKAEELTKKESGSTGFGVYYVRKRLEHFYKGKARLEVESSKGKGTVINITIPPDGSGPTEKKESEDYYDMYSRLVDSQPPSKNR